MYQALYRKWRPKTFDEVIGQEHITETLKNQVRTGHLSHAYIFIGTRGTGKTTCARILAKAVNCENPIDGNPCNRCRYCRGIDDGSILDIVELDAASNTGVDNVRDLKEEAIFSPAAAKKRVYIIDEVHMLSMQAFNALLKIIEEPPEHLMFILATTELQKVPATILSRCQRHSFRRIPTERLAAYLQEIAARESLQLEPEAAVQIGRLAEGGVRDALSILDQCSAGGRITVNTVFETMGLAGNRNLVELLQVILRHDSASALQLFQQIWLDGKEPATFLGELNGLLRDVMIVKAAGAGAEELISGNYERDDLNSFARSMTAEEILYCADTMQSALSRIRTVRNPRIVAELCIVSLCDNRLADTAASLRARLSRLEAEMKKGISVQSRIEVPVESANQPAASEPEGLQDSAKSMLPVENKPEEPESGPELPQDDGQNAVEPEPVPAAPEDAVSGILQEARINLPIEIRFALDDPLRFRMRLYGQDLILEAIPGFLFERMKRPEIRNVFSAAAQRITGLPVAVQVQELKPDQRSLRDLNELKQFPEVSFLS
ncbi:MAG: DNA polymerase III subunit gamma/tau [Oscillospiraceae bacterium]|nr:DNA polymerase III subunit gamma/tau [Oscillospiraceae bacterium]